MELEEEIWKDVSGYEGLYRVSSLGRIESTKTTYNFKYYKTPEKAYTTTIKMLSCQKNPVTGYVAVILCKNKVQKRLYVHVIVATAFLPNPENKKTVNHKFGIRHDNRLSQLEWATHSEQKLDAFKKGYSKTTKGIQTWTSKLTEDDVKKICELYHAGGTTTRQLADQFGIQNPTVTNIINGKTWRHVERQTKDAKIMRKPVLDTSTGIFYDTVSDAAKAKGVDVKYVYANLYISKVNRTCFIAT